MESQSAFMLNRRFEPLGRPFFSSSPASIPNWVDSRSPRLIKYDRFQLALLNGSRHFDVGGFVGEWMGVKGRSGVRKWGCLAIWGFRPKTFFFSLFSLSPINWLLFATLKCCPMIDTQSDLLPIKTSDSKSAVGSWYGRLLWAVVERQHKFSP